MNLSELKIYWVVARGCKKPVFTALVTPSEILFGSVESGMQDETAHEALLSDLSHLESTHYHHGCDGFFFGGGGNL